jgi:hypothetical protein
MHGNSGLKLIDLSSLIKERQKTPLFSAFIEPKKAAMVELSRIIYENYKLE